MARPITVLVVDDSAMVRRILSRGLSADPQLEVVGTAVDPYDARDKLVKLSPDVLTLDVEMPKMDGVEFLRRLMPRRPTPVVMVSALTQCGAQTTLDALQAGAVDFVTKPTCDVTRGLTAMLGELSAKIKVASTANLQRWHRRMPPSGQARPGPAAPLANSTDKVVVIGASTGGTEAIRELLSGLPASGPGVVVVQHMPPHFTNMFAERLDSLCALKVLEAHNGDRILPGHVLIAPGDRQMRVTRLGAEYRVVVDGTELVGGHCPSVDVLMQSAAESLGAHAVGVLLTGMGADGAQGLLAMRRAGARTLAQDEQTSVVFGMPREAHRCGGAECLVPLPDIAPIVVSWLQRMAA